MLGQTRNLASYIYGCRCKSHGQRRVKAEDEDDEASREQKLEFKEKRQFKEQTADELGKANNVLQARMMIIPVGDRRLREEAGSPEHATGVYLVRQNPKIL